MSVGYHWMSHWLRVHGYHWLSHWLSVHGCVQTLSERNKYVRLCVCVCVCVCDCLWNDVKLSSIFQTDSAPLSIPRFLSCLVCSPVLPLSPTSTVPPAPLPSLSLSRAISLSLSPSLSLSLLLSLSLCPYLFLSLSPSPPPPLPLFQPANRDIFPCLKTVVSAHRGPPPRRRIQFPPRHTQFFTLA